MVVVVVFSSHERILGDGFVIHSLSILLLFFKWRSAHTHHFHSVHIGSVSWENCEQVFQSLFPWFCYTMPLNWLKNCHKHYKGYHINIHFPAAISNRLQANQEKTKQNEKPYLNGEGSSSTKLFGRLVIPAPAVDVNLIQPVVELAVAVDLIQRRLHQVLLDLQGCLVLGTEKHRGSTLTIIVITTVTITAETVANNHAHTKCGLLTDNKHKNKYVQEV